MERTISVSGRGKLSLRPDMIRLMMSLEDTFDDYGRTLFESSQQMNGIKDIFEGLGFERCDVKTVSFNIDTQYESFQDEDLSWKKRFIGYKFHHSFKVEFDIDNEKLGKILYELSHGKTCPEFNIVYTVKNADEARDELLRNALKDAVKKAELLSESAGVKLGGIININYSFNDADIVSKPSERLFEASCMKAGGFDADSYDVNIEPDDIEITDTVTVIWNII